MILLLTTALAWESECRDEATAIDFGGRNSNPSASICADKDTPQCEPGMAAARGVQLGEHTFIAQRALSLAGLTPLNTRPFLDYYGTGAMIELADGTQTAQWAPARDGAVGARITRPTVLGEVANLPDYSHSLSDFVLGNEHCFVENLPAGSPVAVKTCHTFNPHMASINSTHFGSQARQSYLNHHDNAVLLATACGEQYQALIDTGDPNAMEYAELFGTSCENQAMAIELFGSHFLADAWSAGHMWQRWGPPTVSDNGADRMRQSAVGIVSGIIHGWRSVARTVPITGDFDAVVHDAMCMPGPFPSPDETAVQWRQLPGDAAPGGGDLYLLQCTTEDNEAEGAVSTSSQLTTQYNRMRACISAGLAEVYDLGPRTLGDRSPAASPEPGITSSTQAECHSPRVTNASFLQGMKMGRTGGDLANAGFGTRLLLDFPLDDQFAGLQATGLTEQEFSVVRAELRVDLARLALVAKVRAHEAALGTDLADLEPPAIQTLLGLERNQNYLTSFGFSPYPTYIDGHASVWPSEGFGACTTDLDCDSGSYCDDTDPADRVCTRPEASLVRAFRPAQLNKTCNTVGAGDIDALRDRCATIAGAACDLCADTVLPMLRNGCDRASWAMLREDSGVNHDSICDLRSPLGGTPQTPIYGLFDPEDPASARAEAMEICTTSTAARDLDPEPFWWAPTTSLVHAELDGAQPSASTDVSSPAVYPGDLEWFAETTDTTLTLSTDAWTNQAGDTQVLTISTSDLTTPRLSQIEVFNSCAPTLRASSQVLVGAADFTYVSFDELPANIVPGNIYTGPGVTVTSATGILRSINGDDSIGAGSVCGSNPANTGCTHDVTLTFSPPVSVVSFYVGDRDLDFTGTWGLEVTADPPISGVQSRMDRRFYGFSGTQISEIVLNPSVDLELIDELRFLPE